MYMHTCTQTRIYIYTYICTYTYTRIHAHTYTHTCTCTPIHRQKISATTPQHVKQYHRHTYASIYICMHIHICIHTHICAQPAANVSQIGTGHINDGSTMDQRCIVGTSIAFTCSSWWLVARTRIIMRKRNRDKQLETEKNWSLF